MKAIVVATKKKDATLLRDDGQFVTVRNRDYVTGETLSMNPTKNKNKVLALASTAAVFILLVVVGVFAYTTPYYYVSLDVNPGMVMEVNRFERVIGFEAMNDDAETYLDTIQWRNQKVMLVLQEAVQELKEDGYFEQSRNVLIAAAGRNDEKATALASKLGTATAALNVENAEVSSAAVGYDMVQSARKLDMTPGKYNLITRLLEETVNKDNVEDYQQQSVQDLMAQFTEMKGTQGRETAADAQKQNSSDTDDEARNEAAETAESVRQEATQRASEAKQDASETKQDADETRQEATQRAADMTQNDEATPQEATEVTQTSQDAEVASQETTSRPTETTIATTAETPPEAKSSDAADRDLDSQNGTVSPGR